MSYESQSYYVHNSNTLVSTPPPQQLSNLHPSIDSNARYVYMLRSVISKDAP